MHNGRQAPRGAGSSRAGREELFPVAVTDELDGSAAADSRRMMVRWQMLLPRARLAPECARLPHADGGLGARRLRAEGSHLDGQARARALFDEHTFPSPSATLALLRPSPRRSAQMVRGDKHAFKLRLSGALSQQSNERVALHVFEQIGLGNLVYSPENGRGDGGDSFPEGSTVTCKPDLSIRKVTHIAQPSRNVLELALGHKGKTSVAFSAESGERDMYLFGALLPKLNDEGLDAALAQMHGKHAGGRSSTAMTMHAVRLRRIAAPASTSAVTGPPLPFADGRPTTPIRANVLERVRHPVLVPITAPRERAREVLAVVEAGGVMARTHVPARGQTRSSA